MKREDYEKAKWLENTIFEIDNVLVGIKKEPASYNCYTLTGVDKINKILGEQFSADLRRKVFDALMLKKLTLEKELSLLIET